MNRFVSSVAVVCCGAWVTAVCGQERTPEGFDPLDPFAGVGSAVEWRDLFREEPQVVDDDPFRNLSAGEWWNRNWGGQWRNAHAEGKTIFEYLATLEGSGGNGAIVQSPYPWTSAEAHWNAWLESADGGTRHTRESLPDWSGDWNGGAQNIINGGVAVRDMWDATAEAYLPHFEQQLQAELEGRNWWPADQCLPNGFLRSGWSFRYFMLDPDMVMIAQDQPVTFYRTAFTDGRGFAPDRLAFPQWYGESQAFWDGDELVIWTRNIIAWTGAHAIPEHSDALEIIERWAMLGDQLVADIVLYDPEAFAYPWHDVAVYQRREDVWAPPVTLNECVSTNNVYHGENGVINQFTPDDPRWRDITDARPWATVYDRAERAKAEGRIPDAPSFLGEHSVRE